jgi:tetratricopeptide (TPR) repeat protein
MPGRLINKRVQSRYSRRGRLTANYVCARILASLFVIPALYMTPLCPAQSLLETEALLLSGEYDQVSEIAGKAIEEEQYGETWRLLKAKADFARGRYVESLDTLDAATEKYVYSIRLRWLGIQVAETAGATASQKKWHAEISNLVDNRPWSYTDAASRVTLGRFLFRENVDPRKILELFYDRAKASQTSFVDAYIAAGELALAKHDFQVAASEFQKALSFEADNADLLYGLALAFASSDSVKADEAIEQALVANPQHVPSLLFIAEHLIDGERYQEAEKWIVRAAAVNPEHWRVWALRAVSAHLQADHDYEGFCRRVALGWRPLNPQVDYEIGRKLSRHYRFSDAAEYQRRALKIDENYLPAKTQLGQDLLRLGQADEGWKLVKEVAAIDGYDVVTHNLLQLNEKLSRFTTLESNGILVRMESREARIYGPQVVALIDEARKVLCEKYKHDLRAPVTIEIYPNQADFAIRTFGLPGGEGFLGVCFGNVVTANSPASQATTPANWQSVLWHEFCHVVTLQKTNNKMPRWLSEGISVYEELQRNAAWGDTLSSQYRTMILGEDLTPVSQLSSAFLKPKSGMHLQFAYYESALVVEYLVGEYGPEMLERVLVDLSVGMPINDSLTRYSGSLEALDEEFAKWIRERASQTGADLDWTPPPKPETPEEPDGQRVATITPEQALEFWAEHPNNYYALQTAAQILLREKQWQAAVEPLEQLLEGFPQERGTGSAGRLLAQVFRQLGEQPRETEMLTRIVREQGNALNEVLRLLEIQREAEDWEGLAETAKRGLAINPLRIESQQALADAAAELDHPQEAIEALRALLELEPIDPAGMHFRLAEQYIRIGEQGQGKRQLLMALEQAPRYRQALMTLREIQEPELPPNPGPEVPPDPGPELPPDPGPEVPLAPAPD